MRNRLSFSCLMALVILSTAAQAQNLGNFQTRTGTGQRAANPASPPTPAPTQVVQPTTTTSTPSAPPRQAISKPAESAQPVESYRPGYYSVRPPEYPGPNANLPQPGVDYFPGGYGYNSYYYPPRGGSYPQYEGYYNGYQTYPPVNGYSRSGDRP